MIFRPSTQRLIERAEVVARDLRVISKRGRPGAHATIRDIRTLQSEYAFSPQVIELLRDLYRDVKHLIPTPRQPYWDQISEVRTNWAAARPGVPNKPWRDLCDAYDRVLEAVYAAQDREGDT